MPDPSAMASPTTDTTAALAAPLGTSYTLTVVFRRAHDLPIADIPSFSSDPFIRAWVSFPGVAFPSLNYRSPTIHRTLNPEWDAKWSVANVPASGLRLDIAVRDEDQGDRDDKLGVATVETGPLSIGWAREDEAGLSVLRGKGGTWIAFTRFLSAGCLHGRTRKLGGSVDISIVVEGTTELPAEELGLEGGKTIPNAYTVGPNWWSMHSSPLIGKMTSTSAQGADGIQHYNFIANKLQLTGPLPPALKQRYVAFAPFVRAYFTSSGLRGKLLYLALKKQYRVIYSYNKNTKYGVVADKPDPEAVGRKFMEMTHWGEGGRLFTYVITLDAEWHFTETGPEFGIQMLSKHTMHSNVCKDVAFAGEMFVHRVRHHRHHQLDGQPGTASSSRPTTSSNKAGSTSNSATAAEPDADAAEKEASRHDLSDFELVIDNDSGTYRPPKEHLPLLQSFLTRNLGGMRVRAMHAFADGHQDEKKSHTAAKKPQRFQQPSSANSLSDDASVSSSDEEELATGHVGMGRKMKRRALGLDQPGTDGLLPEDGDQGEGEEGKLQPVDEGSATHRALKDHGQKWINGVAGTGMMEHEEQRQQKKEQRAAEKEEKQKEKEDEEKPHKHRLHLPHHHHDDDGDGGREKEKEKKEKEKKEEPEPPRGD